MRVRRSFGYLNMKIKIARMRFSAYEQNVGRKAFIL